MSEKYLALCNVYNSTKDKKVKVMCQILINEGESSFNKKLAKYEKDLHRAHIAEFVRKHELTEAAIIAFGFKICPCQ